VSDLPPGWIEATVGEIADDISYGFTAKASSSPTGPRYLRITDIQDGSVDWSSVPSCDISEEKIQRYVLGRGDLVFARTGATTGKSFLITSCPKAIFASYLIRVRPTDSVLPQFIARFFQTPSYWDQISENVSGSAQPNCNASKLASLVVPIAPLPEQRRIVAKLEKLLSRVDTAQARSVDCGRENFARAIRWAKFLPNLERHGRTNWRLQSPAGRRLRSIPRSVASDSGGLVRDVSLQRAVER